MRGRRALFGAGLAGLAFSALLCLIAAGVSGAPGGHGDGTPWVVWGIVLGILSAASVGYAVPE